MHQPNDKRLFWSAVAAYAAMLVLFILVGVLMVLLLRSEFLRMQQFPRGSTMIFRDMMFIAEVKTKSPFGWKSPHSWDELFSVADKCPEADMLSIHTDARWGGSYDLVRMAKKLTSKPILAKGVHQSDDDVRMAFAAGADYVLVVGRYPKVKPERCLAEALTIDGLDAIPRDMKAVWNSRDLHADGGPKKEPFSVARERFPGWLCQASNLRTIGDVHLGADAVLVGQHLPEFITSLSKG